MVIVLFDVSKNEDIIEVEEICLDLRKVSKDIILAIVGNKIDLEVNFCYEQVQELALRFDAIFALVSAKTESNVDMVFEALTRTAIIRRYT